MCLELGLAVLSESRTVDSDSFSLITLNKWLRQRVPDGCVIHSFRHSLRDRLRAIECPADVIDAIGGWTTEGVGHQYGQGHSLSVMHGWMGKLSAFRLVSSKIN